MNRLISILIVIASLWKGVIAQESQRDSASLSDIFQFFLGSNQPRLGFMAQFATEIVDDGNNTTSAFTIRNLRMYFTGSTGEHFKYFFQGSLNQSFEMLDLKLSCIFNEHVRVDGGRFKTPFGVEYLTNDAKLLFVKRSTVASTIGTFRKYGVQAQGSFMDNRIVLTMGAFNGEYSSPKKISLFIGKIQTIPIKMNELINDFQFEVGGSIAYSRNGQDLPFVFYENYHLLRNVNSKFTYGSLWLAGEYFAATSDRNRTQDGFYVDLGGKINSDWEIIGRFDWSAKYLKEVYKDGMWQWILCTDISRKYLIGANYYPLDHLKIQLDYEYDQTQKVNSSWLNLQYAINFE